MRRRKEEDIPVMLGLNDGKGITDQIMLSGKSTIDNCYEVRILKLNRQFPVKNGNIVIPSGKEYELNELIESQRSRTVFCSIGTLDRYIKNLQMMRERWAEEKANETGGEADDQRK